MIGSISCHLFTSVVFFAFVPAQSSIACLEPKFCQCMAGCKVFSNTDEGQTFTPLPCDYRFLVLPNLKIFWDGRLMKQEINWAKEKLNFEAQKEYDATWKTHVIMGKTIGVKSLQALLGMQFSLIKATYGAKIQERVISSRAPQRCEIAKCMAFCSKECESQCESLDSTDESFLAEISWTKDMCDVEKSKAMIKDQCMFIATNGTAEVGGDCDANCDHAGSFSFSFLFILFFVRLIQF